jgi:ABC-type maltose transport system permease subunit
MAAAVLRALPLLIVFLVVNRRIVEDVRVSGVEASRSRLTANGVTV